MECKKAEIREQVIGLIGEVAWQYAFYNFNVDELIRHSESVHELAEIIQDMIARDLSNKLEDAID